MQIPRLTVILTQGGRQFPLRGSIDTGYDGTAVLQPSLQSKIKLPIVGVQRLTGFGGTNVVQVAQADSLGIEGSPVCSLKNAKVVVTEIPGNDEILLGEEFFKQFSFDINYQEGQPIVIACGERVSMLTSWTSSPWLLPAVAVGGLILVGAVFSMFLATEPDRRGS